MKARCGVFIVFLGTVLLAWTCPAMAAVQFDLQTYGPAPYYPDDGGLMHLPAGISWAEGDSQLVTVTVQVVDEASKEVRRTFTEVVDPTQYPTRKYQCDFLWDGRDDQQEPVSYGSYSVYFDVGTSSLSKSDKGGALSSVTLSEAVCGGAQVASRGGAGDTRNNRGDPVNGVSGNLYMEETDLAFESHGPFLGVRRYYNSLRTPLGVGWYNSDGWTFSFHEALRIDPSDQSVTYLPPDGTEFRFKRNPDDSFTPVRPNCRLALYLEQGGGYRVVAPDGFVTRFDSYGGLKSQTDTNNNAVLYTWKNLKPPVPPPIVSRELYWFSEARPKGMFRITRIADSYGRWIQLSYDSGGRVIAATDSIGRKVTYGYPAMPSKLLVEVRPSEGPVRNYTYGEKNHLDGIRVNGVPYSTLEYYPWPYCYTVKRQTFADGSTIDYEYLRDQKKTKITTNSRESLIEYNDEGLITADVDPMGNRIEYTYDGLQRLASLKDPRGATLSYTYDASGNIASVTGLNGATVAYEYDARFAKVSRILFPDSTESRFQYDKKGNLVKKVDALGHTTTYRYNADGLLTRAIFPENDSLFYTYDADGFIESIKDNAKHMIRMTHNPAGWLESLKQADGGIIRFTYDSFGRLKSATDALGRITKYFYDPRYNLNRIDAPDGSVTRYIYDALDRRVGETDPTSRTIGTPYDKDGALARVLDQGAVEFPMGYDPAKRLISRGGPIEHLSVTRDDSGNILSIVNPAAGGRFLGYEYDTAEINVSRTIGTDQVLLTHDPQTSRLLSMNDPAGTTSFAYDALGRLVEKRVPWIGAVHIGYDREGQITQITPPGKSAIEYKFNTARLLSSVEHNGVQLVRYKYDSSQRPVKIILANGIKGELTYDANGNAASVQYSSDTDPNIYTAIYERDTANAIKKQTVSGSLFGDRQETYDCDPAHRLISVNSGGIVTQYAYDSHQNRLLKKVGAAPAETYTYDSTYRLLTAGGTVFSHDADNNVASRAVAGAVTAFVHDSKGRLTQVTLPDDSTEQYVYNGLDERVSSVSSKAGTTRYLWAEGNILATCGASGNINTLFIRGHGLVATVGAGGIHYYLQDGLSNVIAVTNGSASVTQTYRYDPFGLFTETKYAGAIANSFAYGGEWYDSSTGLYYLRNRFYDPGIGRFIAPDPVGPLPEPNPYQYVLNNPLNLEDPTGLSSTPRSPWKIPGTRGLTLDDLMKIDKGLGNLFRSLVWKGWKYDLWLWIHRGGCGAAAGARGQDVANDLPEGWKITGYNWQTGTNWTHTFNIASYTASNGQTYYFYVDTYMGWLQRFPTIQYIGTSIPSFFYQAGGTDGATYEGHN